MTRRVVLLGATGMFGRRLAARLATWPELTLVLAARHAGPLEALRAQLQAEGPAAAIEVAAADRTRPASVVALSPWAVIDAAGPFLGAQYELPSAVVEAGAHWIDLGDGRDYINGFSAALDAAARRAGVLAIAGASSTPALTWAALEAISAGWKRVDRVSAVIAPGAQSPGPSLTQAVLAQAGQRVSCFDGGAWTTRAAWSGLRWRRLPGLGPRLVVLADAPDLDFLPKRARESGLFYAAVEPPLLQALIWLAAWPVRLGLARSLGPLAQVLRAPAALLAALGSPRGGMAVVAEGVGGDGAPQRARWSLAAAAGAGPYVPSAAAAAVLRALVEARLTTAGAAPCVGMAPLADIMRELRELPITTRTECWRENAAGLFPRVLGEAFERLPAPVREVHGGGAGLRLAGRAVSAGRGLGAWLGQVALGLPPRGRHELRVEIAADGSGETWRRSFGPSRFRSRLSRFRADPGQFQERLGPLTFVFSADCDERGFRWRQEGWRFGPLPLPAWLGPQVRARSFARHGGYRFSVLVAHRWLGVMVAYTGRLRVAESREAEDVLASARVTATELLMPRAARTGSGPCR